MLNTVVNKIFLITTLESKRYEYISNHLKDNNIQYQIHISTNYEILTKDIKVIDSGKEETRPALSLLNSFISIIYSSKLSDYDSICIIEDDCYFNKNWQSEFELFYKNLPSDWDLLNIGYHPFHDSHTIKENINEYVYRPLNYHHTTHCMIIKKTVFDEYIKINKKFNYTIPADYVFNEIYKERKYQSFCPTEKIVYQLSVRDDLYKVPDSNVRFKSLLV